MERRQCLQGKPLSINHILPFISSITLGKLFKFPVPQFPHV